MSDAAEVKEAIDEVERAFQSPGRWPSREATEQTVDAARRWVRMVSDGETMEWCWVHRSSGERQRSLPAELRICDFAYAEGDGDDVCHFESRLVAAVGVEKEDL